MTNLDPCSVFYVVSFVFPVDSALASIKATIGLASVSEPAAGAQDGDVEMAAPEAEQEEGEGEGEKSLLGEEVEGVVVRTNET